jgi:DNA-binding transcriptional regulator LsrR (DeoR family)
MSAALKRAGRNLQAARSRLAWATEEAKKAAVADYADGMTETDIARTLGVNRLTVRAWLGKL